MQNDPMASNRLYGSGVEMSYWRKFDYATNRTGVRKFQMYPRYFLLFEKTKCFFLGHLAIYRLYDIRKVTNWYNFSKYRYTCGHCIRCGIGWEDWNYFPYGRGFSENDQAGVEHER